MIRLTITYLTILTVWALSSCGQKNRIDFTHEIKTGIRQYEVDSLEAAIGTFTNIIKQTDISADCFRFRGYAYKDLENYDKALQDFNSCIKLDTTNAASYANRASIYYITNNYQLALDDFKMTLDLNPKNTIMFNPISHMLFATGRKDEACEYYQEALAHGYTEFDGKLKEYCETR